MQNLERLLTAISQPAYFFDVDTWKILVVNDAFVRLLGYEAAALLNMTIGDLRPADDLPRLKRAIAASPPEGSVEWRYLTREGAILDVNLRYRNSVYVDRKTGPRTLRLVVISKPDPVPVKTAGTPFG